MSDMEGKVTRVGASERGQRTSFNGANGMSDIEGKATRVGTSERGQRTSFKIVCCNFCKGLFLKARSRWVDRKEEALSPAIEEESVNTLYAQYNQKTVL